MLQCNVDFVAYSKTNLGLHNDTNVKFIPGLYSNHASLKACLFKDETTWKT